MKFGLIKEGKVPADNRVAFTPLQCKWLHDFKNIEVIVEPSAIRCFTDDEYRAQGVTVSPDLSTCDVLFGIKEIPVNMLLHGKKYFFFSHTKKLQPYNQELFKTMIEKQITLVDYENLEHEDGTRLIGFGFFAGVVGAHNGMLAYGKRSGEFSLKRIYQNYDFQELVGTYFGLKLPNLRIVVTGSGRVAHGILEIMNLMGMHEVEPAEYLKELFSYPVYTNLKGADLYTNMQTNTYDRDEFHDDPELYKCLFPNYLNSTDILINGVYWKNDMPRLFELNDLASGDCKLQTISDITDDMHGSVPCNLGDVTIKEMVYGVDKKSIKRTAPYLAESVDVIAVGNLPNELPKDASRYFGEQLIKYVIDDLGEASEVLDKATMLRDGKLTPRFEYMREFAGL